MTAENLKAMSKGEVLAYIRGRLTINGEKQSFNMSGYDHNVGDCTTHNISLINIFAHLGIYDYTSYLFLDFYKGNPTLYYQYWGSDVNNTEEYGGWSTSEIIYDIFERTIFSGKDTRRRG